MRWQNKHDPYNGELRKKQVFLVFPKKIGDETRWLETAKWWERYTRHSYLDKDGAWVGYQNWEVSEWDDE